MQQHSIVQRSAASSITVTPHCPLTLVVEYLQKMAKYRLCRVQYSTELTECNTVPDWYHNTAVAEPGMLGQISAGTQQV